MNKSISFGAFARSHLEAPNDYLLESKNTSRNRECKTEESTVLTGSSGASMHRHPSLLWKKLHLNGMTVFVNGNHDCSSKKPSVLTRRSLKPLLHDTQACILLKRFPRLHTESWALVQCLTAISLRHSHARHFKSPIHNVHNKKPSSLCQKRITTPSPGVLATLTRHSKNTTRWFVQQPVSTKLCPRGKPKTRKEKRTATANPSSPVRVLLISLKN